MFLRPCLLATWTDTHFTRHFLRLSVIRNRTTQRVKQENKPVFNYCISATATDLSVNTYTNAWIEVFTGIFFSGTWDGTSDGNRRHNGVDECQGRWKNRVWLNTAKDRKGPQRTHKEPQRSFNPKEHITQDHRGSAIMRKLPDLQQFCLIFKNYFVYFL